MKIYARQVNPEYQDCYTFDCLTDDIAIFGNRDFVEHIPDDVLNVKKVLEAGELAAELEYLEEKRFSYAAYNNATEAILDYLPPIHKPRYSTKEIHKIKEALSNYAEARRSIEEESAFLRVLSIVTGKEWLGRQITGCVQCEWNNVFYQTDSWSRSAIDALEVEYFNNGSEWIVQDDGETPESPEAVEGFSLYCVSWDDEEIRKEIANAACCDPCDVIMYKWAGEKRTAVYEEV